jgi:ADP-heptose:LPS heptosyltransferase
MSEMGSTVLALPALMELREAWPDAAVHFVVFRDSRGILDTLGLGAGGRIFEVDGGSPWKLVRTGVAALWRAARLGPEVVLDFDFFSRLSAVFSFLAGRGARVGFMPYHAAGRERGNLLTHRVGYSPLRHTSESFLALVRTVTRDSPGEPFFRGPVADADFRLPQYEPTEEESRKVHELVLEAGVRPGERIFLVNPNASDMLPLRRWPRANFEAVIEGILAMDSQNRVVLAGGGGDVRDCTEIAGSLGRDRVSNLAGRTSLGEFLTLCGLAEAIICNDGGLAHFAGLAGCPAVVIFGPESPDLYRPLCPKAKVLYKALPCSPCVHAFNAKMSACGRAVCLEEITVEEVLDAVRAIPRRERERR